MFCAIDEIKVTAAPYSKPAPLTREFSRRIGVASITTSAYNEAHQTDYLNHGSH